MSIFCGFDEAPQCYDKAYEDSVLASLCTLEGAFAAQRLLISSIAVGPFNNGTTYAAIAGLTNIPFTVPAIGSPNWYLVAYLGYFHDRNSCGVEIRVVVDGAQIGHTHNSPPNIAAGATPPAIHVVDSPIIGVAAQGNHLATVEFRRTDVFSACNAGVVATVSTVRLLLFGIPQ